MTSSTHWLWRLDAASWMSAAVAELDRARASSVRRRRALTHLRRASGMALNAVLVAWSHAPECPVDVEVVWGRSYLQHLEAVARPDADPHPLGNDVALLARALLSIPIDPPPLIGLGRERHADLRRAFDATTALCTHCARYVAQSRAAP